MYKILFAFEFCFPDRKMESKFSEDQSSEMHHMLFTQRAMVNSPDKFPYTINAFQFMSLENREVAETLVAETLGLWENEVKFPWTVFSIHY